MSRTSQPPESNMTRPLHELVLACDALTQAPHPGERARVRRCILGHHRVGLLCIEGLCHLHSGQRQLKIDAWQVHFSIVEGAYRAGHVSLVSSAYSRISPCHPSTSLLELKQKCADKLCMLALQIGIDSIAVHQALEAFKQLEGGANSGALIKALQQKSTHFSLR